MPGPCFFPGSLARSFARSLSVSARSRPALLRCLAVSLRGFRGALLRSMQAEKPSPTVGLHIEGYFPRPLPFFFSCSFSSRSPARFGAVVVSKEIAWSACVGGRGVTFQPQNAGAP